MKNNITLHVVFHAHLDAVWLWQWYEGVDEVLSTFRSACDRLDNHPEIFFSQGEAWCYSQVERLDPALFKRIQKYVENGRWELTGGWWTQPDCNFPDIDGFRKQIECGKKYFISRFGKFPKIGFNPDSFGHSAALPDLLREFGQTHYVMMRPQEHELALPRRLFRWRGAPNGEVVTVFRIASSYLFSTELDDTELEKRIRSCVSELPEGVTHSLLLAGVGDHGGGPTEELILWLKEHRNAFPGITLKFSTLENFFEELNKENPALPFVTGELQHHAIGCYSVHRGVKKALRDATQRLLQAETLRKDLNTSEQILLDEYWHKTVFHQFHDTAAGTCMPSAYTHIIHELNGAEAFAEELLQYAVRKKAVALHDDEYQRLILLNASDKPFFGWMECDPYLGWRKGLCEYVLLDEEGKQVPYQWIPRDIVFCDEKLTRIVLKLSAKPGALRVFRFVPAVNTGKSDTHSGVTAAEAFIENNLHTGVNFRKSVLMLSGKEISIPEPILLLDDSDTWSHGLDHYSGESVDTVSWNTPEFNLTGPYLWEIVQQGRIGISTVRRIFHIYSDSSEIHFILQIDWHEIQKLLKLVIPLNKSVPSRMDGICNGYIERNMDEKEYPMQHWTHIPFSGDEGFTVISPDVFALDGTSERIRLTLLRSCMLAQHDPWKHEHICVARYADRGEHEFRFILSHGKFLPENNNLKAIELLRHIPSANLTRGMKKVY